MENTPKQLSEICIVLKHMKMSLNNTCWHSRWLVPGILQRIKAVFHNVYKITGVGTQMKNWPVHLESLGFCKGDECIGLVETK